MFCAGGSGLSSPSFRPCPCPCRFSSWPRGTSFWFSVTGIGSPFAAASAVAKICSTACLVAGSGAAACAAACALWRCAAAGSGAPCASGSGAGGGGSTGGVVACCGPSAGGVAQSPLLKARPSPVIPVSAPPNNASTVAACATSPAVPGWSPLAGSMILPWRTCAVAPSTAFCHPELSVFRPRSRQPREIPPANSFSSGNIISVAISVAAVASARGTVLCAIISARIFVSAAACVWPAC